MMKLKRKMFAFGLGNFKLAGSQFYKAITNKSITKGNPQNLTLGGRFKTGLSGVNNLAKGAIKATGGVALTGAALGVGGVALGKSLLQDSDKS